MHLRKLSAMLRSLTSNGKRRFRTNLNSTIINHDKKRRVSLIGSTKESTGTPQQDLWLLRPIYDRTKSRTGISNHSQINTSPSRAKEMSQITDDIMISRIHGYKRLFNRHLGLHMSCAPRVSSFLLIYFPYTNVIIVVVLLCVTLAAYPRPWKTQ